MSPFQGFQTLLSDSPTAHAVGYDLPPSGLKTETVRTISSDDTDFCGNGRPLFSDLSETSDEPTKMPRVMSPGQEVLRSNCVARPVSHHAKFVSRL